MIKLEPEASSYILSLRRCKTSSSFTLFSSCDSFFSHNPAVLWPPAVLLSQEKLCELGCWVTFHGRLPLSPEKHNIEAVGYKRRNFGQEQPVVRHVFTARTGIAATLPQSFTGVTCFSLQHEEVWKIQQKRSVTQQILGKVSPLLTLFALRPPRIWSSYVFQVTFLYQMQSKCAKLRVSSGWTHGKHVAVINTSSLQVSKHHQVAVTVD